ncbi:MAG: hypothetical protein K8R56_03465 [Candidatus Eisenbacteria bacterium]|nr:hypothetical protein [Candidatus Eisenbacteria bacterium]
MTQVGTMHDETTAVAGVKTVMQAYIELRSEDSEAASALSVARARLEAARALVSVRRVRLFELAGVLPEPTEVAALLHRSTRFYNPAKERCTVRASAEDPAPFRAHEHLVLVVDRALDRRTAAERWWKHETGAKLEVREGLVWALGFADGVDAAAMTQALAVVRDRAHGLLSNPHFQDASVAQGALPPWPWIKARPRARKGGRS